MTQCAKCGYKISFTVSPARPYERPEWRLGLGGDHMCIDRGVHIPTYTELDKFWFDSLDPAYPV